jgi:hypothetical protein
MLPFVFSVTREGQASFGCATHRLADVCRGSLSYGVQYMQACGMVALLPWFFEILSITGGLLAQLWLAVVLCSLSGSFSSASPACSLGSTSLAALFFRS